MNSLYINAACLCVSSHCGVHMGFALFLLTSALLACNAMSHPKFQLESTMCIQSFKPGSTNKNSDAHRLPPDNDRNKLILERN